KRREFADVRGRALSALADACLRSGDAPAAAKWAEQTIALAPFRETGYRRLMEAHVAAGNRAEALQVYEQCRRLLADELGPPPPPDTASVYRELLETTPYEAPASVEPEPSRPAGRRRRPIGKLAAAGGLAVLAIAAVVGLVAFRGGGGGDRSIEA